MKNIILDIGGIIFDDSRENIDRLLNKDSKLIYDIAFGKGFKECLLGYKTVEQYIDSLKNNPDFDDIKYILNKENLSLSYPLITKNFEYVKSLKNRGYKLFLLTNITEDSYNYINSAIDIEKFFEGGIYSFKEHIVKPNEDIYRLIIDRYDLNLDETIFFDDSKKNVDAAIKMGIKSVKFNSLDDMRKVIDFRENEKI